MGVVTQAIDSPFDGAALRGTEDGLDPAGCSRCSSAATGVQRPNRAASRCCDHAGCAAASRSAGG